MQTSHYPKLIKPDSIIKEKEFFVSVIHFLIHTKFEFYFVIFKQSEKQSYYGHDTFRILL